jgi:transcription antitermination factor NusG
MSLEWKVGDKVGFVDLAKRRPVPKPEPGSETWFVMEVFAGHEEYFFEKLNEVIYFPRKVIWRKVKRVKKDGVRLREKYAIPLIAGYVFLNSDLEHPGVRWMFEDRRLIGVLSFAGIPLRIPSGEVARLKLAESSGDYDETRKIFSSIIGTIVEVQSGPFAEKYVHVHSFHDGKFRGTLLGSDLDVQIPLSNLEKIGH